MSACIIREVSIQFPFEPYEIQKKYMEKVIECLQTETTGILESPTGTGKTLSLLCSSLAWLSITKEQIRANCGKNDYIELGNEQLENEMEEAPRVFLGLPTIIYASRTHSQLSQAMQELKRSSYNHMNSCIIGSREQLCIHPEIINEESHAAKIHLCRLKVKNRSCSYYNRVERVANEKFVADLNVADIEDLMKLGEKHKFCPYYMASNLKRKADIIFMPYNYLLDPRLRKALDLQLAGNVIILDEAHNVERICEDSASVQLRSTELTLCIEEVTEVMKAVSTEPVSIDDSNLPKDFTADELCVLKQMLLDFEKAFDEVPLRQGPEGNTFEAKLIFELLEKANIRLDNVNMIIGLIDKIIQFLTTVQEGPFARKGNGLQVFEEMLRIVFLETSSQFKEKVNKCYKVFITLEEVKKKNHNTSWFDKVSASSKSMCRVLNYWCFSPAFGMSMLMGHGIRSIILTSGTLAPLKPFITELGIKVGTQLENPHIIDNTQVCVRIITSGPDSEILNCSYKNRDNTNYVSSLGRTILNLSRIIPDGMLIFFPSYPVLQKCKDQWEREGLWSNINQVKTLFVEPKQKHAFTTAMNDYCARIKDPNSKGAIFIGVCRGKISEGLDFADNIGRAVIIVGLPFPPLKDPRIILKKKYLDGCCVHDREFLKGNEWYSLEAIRAVNQAIGRIIRHRYDYGAIILLDERFTDWRIQSQLSLWLRDRIKIVNRFGEVIRDLKSFFVNAKKTLPVAPADNAGASSSAPKTSDTDVRTEKKGNFNFSTSTTCSFDNSKNKSTSNLVNIHKKSPEDVLTNPPKRKKIVLVPNHSENIKETSYKDYISLVKKHLKPEKFRDFVGALTNYSSSHNIEKFTQELDKIFLNNYNNRFLLQGLCQYVKDKDKEVYSEYWEKMK